MGGRTGACWWVGTAEATATVLTGMVDVDGVVDVVVGMVVMATGAAPPCKKNHQKN